VMPSLNAMMSRRTPADQQGELQGLNGSMSAIAFLIAQLVYNNVLAFFTSPEAPFRFTGAPFALAIGFTLVALAGLLLLPRSEEKSA
jgi:MFS transporter, DHA1 family, tetracycline resistance protein